MRSMLPMRARRPVRWATLTMLVSQLLLLGALPAMAKEPQLDHFWCYPAKGDSLQVKVGLQDQFDKQPVTALVGAPSRLCNPVTKVHNGVVTEIRDRDAHLTFYRIHTTVSSWWSVQVYNQFGTQKLRAGPATALAVPTFKMLPGHEPPVGLDHFKCYRAKGNRVDEGVALRDQFQVAQVKVGAPVLFCNPTLKVHDGKVTKIEHPEAHLTCYQTSPSTPFDKVVPVSNQFGKTKLSLSSPNLLCVPSFKLAYHRVPIGG
jgi:hypothetical protein